MDRTSSAPPEAAGNDSTLTTSMVSVELTVDDASSQLSSAATKQAVDEEAKKGFWHNKIFTVCIWILMTEAMERLTYYTIQGSQRNFLQSFGYSNAQSTSLNSAFSVICYLWPLLGGWAADAKFGKYKVILVGSAVYAVGTYLTAIAADPNLRLLPMYFVGTFGLIAAGTGAIKPNVCNFGGDQYNPQDPQERKEQESFFNWFYLSINISAAIAFGYLVTLATNGSGAIPKEWGFTAAYSIAAVSMSIAVVAFAAGTKKYVMKLPGGDVLAGLCSYIVQSARGSLKGAMSVLGWVLLAVFLVLSVVQAFMTDEATAHILSFTALALAVASNTVLVVCHVDNAHLEALPENSWLTVEEAQGALDVVPILLVVNISFSIIYNLMAGAFVAQACQMDLSLGGSGEAQLNGGFFNIADCLAIMLFVPLFEVVVFPSVAWCKGGKQISRSEKLVSGIGLSIVGVMCAVLLEYLREASPDTGIQSNCAPDGATMSSISAFWMSVPFAVVGMGEVLVNPVLIYFAYNQAPVRTRSVMQAFNLLCQGAISSAYTAALTTAMTFWFTDDLNDGNLSYYYFVNAAIGAMGIPLYFVVSRRYKEKDWEGCDAEDKPSRANNKAGNGNGPAVMMTAHGHCGDLVQPSDPSAPRMLHSFRSTMSRGL